MFTPFFKARSATPSSSVTPSASNMHDVSASVATAITFALDIIVIQTLSDSAFPITQLRRSPTYAPQTSLSGEGIATTDSPNSFAKVSTVILFFLAVSGV